MRAMVYYAPGDLRLEERPLPLRADDNLVVAVRACALCGTDLKLATVGNPRCHAPRIIGHEMAGTIVHAGRNVAGFSEGERVTLATTIACGQCRICALGLPNLCPDSKPISYDYDGALAEYMAIPPAALRGGNVIKIPQGLGDEVASLSEPLSCAVNAQEIAGVRSGDSVLVVGGGPLGAIQALLAAACGAGKVMIVQRSEPRLSMLRRLKGVMVIDGKSETVRQVVERRTNGLGADVVIVCAPARDAQEAAVAFARKGGTVSLFASLPKGAADITLDSRLVHYGERRVVGASDSRPEHVRKAVALLAEFKHDFEKVITHSFPLGQCAEAIELMKRKQTMKVVICPGVKP